jgi:hypothetical protein
VTVKQASATPGRPFFAFSAQELETRAREGWNSVETLQGIVAELKHRTTAKAQRLERDVVQRLAALGVTTDVPPAAGQTGAADPQVQELGARALRAEQQARELAERLRVAEAELERLRSADQDGKGALYARVGLHPSCPDFVLRVVRRAFRREYHPDALSDRPRAEQLTAQELFKEHEGVFDAIEAQRR